MVAARTRKCHALPAIDDNQNPSCLETAGYVDRHFAGFGTIRARSDEMSASSASVFDGDMDRDLG